MRGSVLAELYFVSHSLFIGMICETDFKMLSSFSCLLCLMIIRVQAGVLSSEECNNTVFINDRYYVSERLKQLSGIPADLSVNFQSGTIFFTLISNEMRMSLYRLKQTSEMDRITLEGLGQSTTIDNLNNIVYLATDNGIYKYNEESGTAELYAASGEDVMYVALADSGRIIYIATWPQNRVRKLEGQKSQPFKPIANGHGLTVDNRNNIYYEAVKTPYVLKNGDTVSIKINGFNPGKMVDFFIAKSGEVFSMDEDSNLYKIDADNALAKSLGSFGLEGVNTFGIDASNNILIGVKDTIWKWVLQEGNPCKNVIGSK